MAETDSKPYGVIYCITNKVNGKKYIGQTVGTAAKRWKSHISDKTGCRLLKNAISKYGVDSFSIEVLRYAFDADELNTAETTLISEYKTQNRSHGYNLNPGGKSGKQHPETVAKRSEALRGKPLSLEHCAKLSSSHMGHTRSAESIVKQRKSAIGKKRPPRTAEHIAKIISTVTGKKRGPMTDAHKAALSASHKGKVCGPMSEAQKAKRSAKMSGIPKKWSPEGRERTLAASRAYWERYRLEKALQI